MAAMTLFHAGTWCHLVMSKNEASAARLCCSVRQFLIFSTLALVS